MCAASRDAQLWKPREGLLPLSSPSVAPRPQAVGRLQSLDRRWNKRKFGKKKQKILFSATLSEFCERERDKVRVNYVAEKCRR